MLTIVTPTRSYPLTSELLTLLNKTLISDFGHTGLAEYAKEFAQMLIDSMSAQDYMLNPEIHEAFTKLGVYKEMK